MQFLLHHYSIWSNHSLSRRVLRIPCLCLIGRALSIGIQPENPVKSKERNCSVPATRTTHPCICPFCILKSLLAWSMGQQFEAPANNQQPTANSQLSWDIRRLHANKSTFQLIIVVTLLLRFLTYSRHVGISSESHVCMPVIEQWLLGCRRPAITIYLK